MFNKIRPIPNDYGVGYCSLNKLSDELFQGFREEQVGRYWNYFVTANHWDCPLEPIDYLKKDLVIDGFSPNLNKQLHVGHLRNLALANSLSKIFNCKMVAILGASLGIKEEALKVLTNWFEFLNYKPEVYYDIDMPECVEYRIETDMALNSQGAGVWDGPNGQVIVVRTDGRKTYAYYDLAFAKTVKPTQYITGMEQKEHFASLGLSENHLPMGLVLGKTDKGWGKLKSRTGDAMSAEEMIQEIVNSLKQGSLQKPKEPLTDDDYRKVAWNIIAWNLLHIARIKDVKFEPEKWAMPDEPGLYISYTYARVQKALSFVNVALNPELTQDDVNLLGYSCYFNLHYIHAIEGFDAAPIANFAHDLARKLNVAYESERIIGGREGFKSACCIAANILGNCMQMLGMFKLMRL